MKSLFKKLRNGLSGHGHGHERTTSTSTVFSQEPVHYDNGSPPAYTVMEPEQQGPQESGSTQVLTRTGYVTATGTGKNKAEGSGGMEEQPEAAVGGGTGSSASPGRGPPVTVQHAFEAVGRKVAKLVEDRKERKGPLKVYLFWVCDQASRDIVQSTLPSFLAELRSVYSFIRFSALSDPIYLADSLADALTAHEMHLLAHKEGCYSPWNQYHVLKALGYDLLEFPPMKEARSRISLQDQTAYEAVHLIAGLIPPTLTDSSTDKPTSLGTVRLRSAALLIGDLDPKDKSRGHRSVSLHLVGTMNAHGLPAYSIRHLALGTPGMGDNCVFVARPSPSEREKLNEILVKLVPGFDEQARKQTYIWRSNTDEMRDVLTKMEEHWEVAARECLTGVATELECVRYEDNGGNELFYDDSNNNPSAWA